ncbi:MAG: helix-turn-helix transcriptional regulator [Prevotella sp.]|nr:helix-turn-helix transcriptional regulator [Prevotella sp.]
MELHEKFRKALLVLRRRDMKLTQNDIAMEADMSLRYYQNLESGKRKNPSLDIVDKIAHAHGMTLSEFCKIMEDMD